MCRDRYDSMTRARSTAKPTRPRSHTASRATPANRADRQIKIGEAARIIGVEAYVLRFWETQFPFLRPRHSRSKHRYYDEKSLDSLRLIRRLLHSEGYTIAGAKKHIREAGLERLRGGSEGDISREGDRLRGNESGRVHGNEAERPRASSAGDRPKAAESMEPATQDHGEASPTSLHSGELSRATQNKLAAIREELKSLHKLLAG
jgi:DNA-binding transcriptional MerR regulator